MNVLCEHCKSCSKKALELAFWLVVSDTVASSAYGCRDHVDHLNLAKYYSYNIIIEKEFFTLEGNEKWRPGANGLHIYTRGAPFNLKL